MTEREIARKKAAARKARERKARNRRVVLTVCLMLAVCVASIGGTIAWLTDTTAEVKNTFSPSNIGLTLVETNEEGEEVYAQNYKMVPGEDYTKDPKVTITNDVEAWLFVEIEASENIGTYLTYTIDETGWTKGSGDAEGEGKGVPANVLFRKVGAKEATKSWELLTGNKVTVNSSVTKEQMAVLDSTEIYPNISFKAYAIQTSSFATAGAAWAQLNPTTSEVPGEPESGT